MIMMMMPMTMRQKEVVVSLRRRAGAATSNAALVPSAWTLLDLQRLHDVQSASPKQPWDRIPSPSPRLGAPPHTPQTHPPTHLWFGGRVVFPGKVKKKKGLEGKEDTDSHGCGVVV